MSFLNQAHLSRLRHDEPSQYAELMRTHMPLGYHPESHDLLYIPDVDRYAGTYMLGVQGTGKSALMMSPIHHDCAVGKAVIVIDPHGDLVDHCVANMPITRLKQTYVLDMADENYPFGLNLFALSGPLTSEMARTQAAERIYHLFEVLWHDSFGQANFPRYLHAATHVFLDNPGATLVDMLQFLRKPKYRAKLLRNVTDPMVRQFWEDHNELLPRDQDARVQSLVNKLETLFMGRGLVRNIVGQRRTTISFRQAIENRDIILIKLPYKQVPEDARLIGTFLVAQISMAIFSFADVPESQRPGVSVYVDEGQNFANGDFASLYSEGRKFGARIFIAHQWRKQLPPFLQEATKSARTKIVLQTNAEDATEMSQYFPVSETTVDPESVSTTMDKVLRTRTSDFPAVVQTFVRAYLVPLQADLKGGRVDIGEHLDINWKATILWGARAGVGKRPMWVDDPTDMLNALFYECMTTGTADLPIPWEVAIGFCMTGGKFFSAIKSSNDTLRPDYEFPAHLVVAGQWTRPPESAKEKLLCFVFHLRKTMEYLAANPVGKKTTTNTAAVAQWINNLPPRMAYVRSGDKKYMIRTLDMPPEVTGDELGRRWETIRAQTRARYCHSVSQVNQVLNLTPFEQPKPTVDAATVDVTEIAGWGQVGEP